MACAGKRHAPANSVKSVLDEGSKNRFISGPAAEYMSKIAWKEEKNQTCGGAFFVTEGCGGGASPRRDGAEPRPHTPNEMT